jgi:hypothetical protein
MFQALCRSSSGTSTAFEPLVYIRLRRPPLVLSGWELGVPTQTAPRVDAASICKPEAQIQLRFLIMSDMALETCWTIDVCRIINSVTELHLVGNYTSLRFFSFLITFLFFCIYRALPTMKKKELSSSREKTGKILEFFFAVALRPSAGHGLFILGVSRSHTTTHHSR